MPEMTILEQLAQAWSTGAYVTVTMKNSREIKGVVLSRPNEVDAEIITYMTAEGVVGLDASGGVPETFEIAAVEKVEAHGL